MFTTLYCWPRSTYLIAGLCKNNLAELGDWDQVKIENDGSLLNRSWKLANSQNELVMASLKTFQPQEGRYHQKVISEQLAEIC